MKPDYTQKYKVRVATLVRLAEKNKIEYKTRYSSIVEFCDNEGLLEKECRRIVTNRKKIKKYRGNRIRRMINLARRNPEYLGLLIHTVNKWAKHYRDSQQNMAGIIYEGTHYGIVISPTHHDILHSAKLAKEECYALKERAIKWALKKGIAKKNGWHTFVDSNGYEMFAEFVVIGGFSFHYNLTEEAPEEEKEIKKINCKFSEISDKKLKNIYDVKLALMSIINQ